MRRHFLFLVLTASCANADAAPVVRPACGCTEGLNMPKLAADHKRAWGKVFDGTPLDDTELQALADAQGLIECLEAILG